MNATEVVELLRKGIAEDETEARRGRSIAHSDRPFERDDYGQLLVQPSRVAAWCEAQRRIIELITDADDGTASPATLVLGDEVLTALASVYGGHAGRGAAE